jgi:mitochondrial fission protein ELM1
LIDALGDLCDVDHTEVALLSRGAALRTAVTRHYAGLTAASQPHLVIGAGRACHASLAAVRRATHAKAIVLMRPSLPLGWFDLAIIPRHDGVPAGAGVLLSEGMLNRVSAPAARDETRGLMLIGGPSRHYGWDESRLLAQIDALLADGSVRRWDIADSRRTPPPTGAALAARFSARVEFHSATTTSANTIRSLLQASHYSWVSEDSMSMCFEALSAGGRVGLHAVPRRREGRVSRAIDQLLAARRVVRQGDWARGIRPIHSPPLDEARRCASFVLDHLLTS